MAPSGSCGGPLGISTVHIWFDHCSERSHDQSRKPDGALEIPAGYKVSKLPESISIQEPDYSINVSYEQIGNEILYKKKFEFKKGLVKATDFTEWNAFMEKLNKLYNEQVTLTKS